VENREENDRAPTQVTGSPIIPQFSSRIACIERVFLRLESLLDCAKRDTGGDRRESCAARRAELRRKRGSQFAESTLRFSNEPHPSSTIS
jgi:hypothetical protein